MTLNKKDILILAKDYIQILVGLICYAVGFTCFMLPYKITNGGVSGISGLIYFQTGFPASYSYLIINLLLMVLALKIMGWRYTLRTFVGTILISVLISIIQDMMTVDGEMMMVVGEQKFMACVLGACFEGFGLGMVFLSGGSTGGTDIIASSVNKHFNISIGRVLLLLDVIIVSSNWFIIHDVETLVVSFCTMFISMNLVDYVINGGRQSVQFLIISEHYKEIADRINKDLDRGVTVIDGHGWYSGQERPVLMVIAKKYERRDIFIYIHQIDPKAFVSMSNVEAVFGEGFDAIKK